MLFKQSVFITNLIEHIVGIASDTSTHPTRTISAVCDSLIKTAAGFFSCRRYAIHITHIFAREHASFTLLLHLINDAPKRVYTRVLGGLTIGRHRPRLAQSAHP